MARLAVTFTVIFYLFAFSYARTPLDLPVIDDVNSHDPSITLPESDFKTTSTILLPSEKPESEPDTIVQLEPESRETRPLEIEINSGDSIPGAETYPDEAPSLKRPSSVIMRPIYGQFPHMHSSRPFPFRMGHRCRHHFGEGRRFAGREIPYGNDMILSSEDLNADSMFHDGMPRIPARWARFHHHGRPEFSFRNEMWNKEGMTRPFHPEEEEEEHENGHGHGHVHKHDEEREDHEHRHEEEEDEKHDHRHGHKHHDEEEEDHDHDHHDEHEHEHGHRHWHRHGQGHEHSGGGLVRRFRKFMTQF